MESTAINDVLNQLDTAVSHYVFNGYADLSSALSTTVTMALSAYIMFVGWSTMQSWAPLTGGNAVKHVMKVTIAVMLASHWDFFSTMIYDTMTNGPSQLADILVGSSGKNVTTGNQALQDVFNKGITKGNEVWKKGGTLSGGYYLGAIIIYLFDYLSVGFALLETAVAKCGLGLTLVLAPIFSLCLLWEGGKGIFSAWLKTAFGFALVPLILTSVMMIMTPILDSGLDAINADNMENGMSCLSAFILGSFACIGLLLKSAQMASSIAGGLNISASDSMAGAASAAGMGKAMGSMVLGAATGGAGFAMQAGRWVAQKARG